MMINCHSQMTVGNVAGNGQERMDVARFLEPDVTVVKEWIHLSWCTENQELNFYENYQRRLEMMLLNEVDLKLVLRELKHYINQCEDESLDGVVECYKLIESSGGVRFEDIGLVRVLLEKMMDGYVQQKNCCEGMDDADLRMVYTVRIKEINEVLQNI